jgi:hypothetical protein
VAIFLDAELTVARTKNKKKKKKRRGYSRVDSALPLCGWTEA